MSSSDASFLKVRIIYGDQHKMSFPSICFLDRIKNLSAIKRGRKYLTAA